MDTSRKHDARLTSEEDVEAREEINVRGRVRRIVRRHLVNDIHGCVYALSYRQHISTPHLHVARDDCRSRLLPRQ